MEKLFAPLIRRSTAYRSLEGNSRLESLSLREQIDAMAAETAALRQMNERLSADGDRVRSESDRHLDRIRQLESELVRATERLDALQAAAESAPTEDYLNRIRQLEAELVQHNGRTAELQAAEARACAAAESYLNRIRQLEAEMVHLNARNAALETAQARHTDLILAKLSLLEYRNASLLGAAAGGGAVADSGAASLYLDLLEATLTGVLTEDESVSPWTDGGYDAELRTLGRDWPKSALTMIGVVRMRNIRHLVQRVLAEGVPGDLIETGVWRGGACIFMRGILAAHGVTDRKVWVADSFRGLPPPDPDLFTADSGDLHHTYDALAVSADEVRDNFRRFGLLDEQVAFLEGWFKDTLARAPIRRLAVLRLDGDMYESTIQSLDALYDKVSPGGYVIVDDYILPPCRQAVDDYRTRHGIEAPLETVDGAAVYWRKGADERVRTERG